MKKLKVVIVENDEDEQLFMREGFEESGHFEVVAQLRNGDLLIRWLETNESSLPDIILTDLNMPGKNGYEILNYVKGSETFRHIPVIITSTSSTASIIEKCLEAGADKYLVKPDTFIEYRPYAEKLFDILRESNMIKE